MSKYILKADSNCWMVCEVKTAEKGKSAGQEREAPEGYYANLEQAAKGMLQRIIRDKVQDRQGMDVILVAIKEALAEVTVAVKELGHK